MLDTIHKDLTNIRQKNKNQLKKPRFQSKKQREKTKNQFDDNNNLQNHRSINVTNLSKR